ncbi:uncharacterized protein NPIL_36581 [Nephila pilipes]|uniref:Uncharacterized protein n=1 Tax=Nephila pilipes TaxID=299642 RepID=A0A8X6UBG5_NEPPI|nr:uncharacterized protein NPIL_36581 [Nephila pilipes]
MVVEECKYNLSLEAFGCIPFSVDYPHNDSICNDCEDCFNMTHIANDCSKLLNKYNQPCHYIYYNMKLEEKPVSIEKKLVNHHSNISEYDCSKSAIFTRRCQMIHVEISFKDFEITTTTYEPKLEDFIYKALRFMSISHYFSAEKNRSNIISEPNNKPFVQ